MPRSKRIEGAAASCLPVLLALAGSAPAARAAVCKDQKVLEDLWEEYDRAARSMGCAAPARGPFQYMACVAIAPGKKPIKILDRMLGFWNSMAKGGWATIGPRMLGPQWEQGKLVGTTGRTFVAAAPANSGKVTVRILKTDGKAETEVTVCATRKGEKPRVVWNFRIANGADNLGREFKRDFADIADSIVSMHLDAKSVTNTFSYKIRLDAEPVRWDFGAVEGWADLHLHQAAELAHAGTMYYGSHTGPLPTALKACAWQQHGLPFNVGKWDQYRHGNGYPTYTSWPHHLDIGHQQAHETWLEEAHRKGLKLVVVSAVNNEPGCRLFSLLHPRPGASCKDMPNLNAQVDAFIRFDEKHDWYEIAVDPWHARKIIHEGKLAVVLSLESSHPFPADAGDFVEQLDQLYAKGVRTLQTTHEVDSRFAGAAPWSNMFEALQAVKYPVDFDKDYLKTLTSLKPGFDYETVVRDGKTGKFNRVGLKPDGYRLLDAMVARHMPVDVAHMSVKGTEEVYAHLLQKHGGYPMYMSHSRFGALLFREDAKKQQEFVTSEGQIEMIKKLGGMVGLRTGPQPIKPTPRAREDQVLQKGCHGTVRSFRNLIAYGLRRGVTVALGTDLNGNTSHMGSRFAAGQTGCPGGGTPEEATPPAGVGAEFVTHGLRHVGLVDDMLADLRHLDPAAAAALDRSAEAYLEMWERAWTLGGGGQDGAPVIPGHGGQPRGCKTDADCGAGTYCDLGWATLGKNQCLTVKAVCSSCSADKQCGPGRECKGVIGLKKCIQPNALGMGASCCVNEQCRSGQCDKGKCVCSDDGDCASTQYCDKGTLTLGVNQCVARKANGKGCTRGAQCQSGRCSFGFCAAEKECARDADCKSGEYCDEGTAGIGKNQCKAKKAQGDACSRGGQCKSSCCKLYKFKLQCRPANKCD